MARPTSGPSAEDLEAAVSKLTTAVQTLRAVAHRHKNQHRVSKWWAPFDMLRRNAGKLADEADAARKQAYRPPKPKKRPGPESGSAAGVRAAWMRAECAPRAYLAFSQLAADNQHAPLGLLLLGVLADVHAAVGLVLGKDDGAAPPPLDLREVPARDGDAEVAGAEELGVAVSRDSVELVGHVGDVDVEAADGRTAVQEKAVVRRFKEAEAVEKKRKKRKKPGDEFDDLFSSLI